MEVHEWQHGLHPNIAAYSSISTCTPGSLLNQKEQISTSEGNLSCQA